MKINKLFLGDMNELSAHEIAARLLQTFMPGLTLIDPNVYPFYDKSQSPVFEKAYQIMDDAFKAQPDGEIQDVYPAKFYLDQVNNNKVKGTIILYRNVAHKNLHEIKEHVMILRDLPKGTNHLQKHADNFVKGLVGPKLRLVDPELYNMKENEIEDWLKKFISGLGQDERAGLKLRSITVYEVGGGSKNVDVIFDVPSTQETLGTTTFVLRAEQDPDWK